MKRIWLELVRDLLVALLGCAAVAASLAIFTIPNDIAPGGVSGLATALAHLLPLRVSIWMLLLNVPLFLSAAWKLGIRPLIKTLVCTVLLSVMVELMQRFLPVYQGSPIMAALAGGVLLGAGVGILFTRGLSTGGTDLLSLLLSRHFRNTSMGTMMIVLDGAVVLIAVLVFRNIDVALNSAIAIFVQGKLIDTIAQGLNYAKVVYIITERGEEMTDLLNTYIDRGVTMLPAVGGYSRKEKTLLMTVVKRSSLAQTLQLVKHFDPKAFMYVVSTTEVHGEGFQAME